MPWSRTEWAKARAKTLGEINAGAVQSPSDVAAANELKRQEAAEAELASASAASGSGQSDDALAAAVYESRSQMTRLGDEVHLSNRASPPKSGRSAGGDVNSSELVAASYLGMSTNNPLAVTMSPVQGIAGSARFSTCAPADTLASLRYRCATSFVLTERAGTNHRNCCKQHKDVLSDGDGITTGHLQCIRWQHLLR